jgi:hypothetical protein
MVSLTEKEEPVHVEQEAGRTAGDLEKKFFLLLLGFFLGFFLRFFYCLTSVIHLALIVKIILYSVLGAMLLCQNKYIKNHQKYNK